MSFEGGTPDHRTNPRSGYFLASGMDGWPEMAMIGLREVAVYIAAGIWAKSYGAERIHRHTAQGYRRAYRCDTRQLVAAGLWLPTDEHDTYTTLGIPQLRADRARSGYVMRLSIHSMDGAEGHRAGLAALGVWALAASWSLTTETPGYIPTEVATRIGKPRHIAALWHSGMWIVDEYGFHMSQGSHVLERWWSVHRADDREPIPLEVRRAVFARDGWKCLKCGSKRKLTLDHIYPWSKGGPDTMDNLQTLCGSCNSAKGPRLE